MPRPRKKTCARLRNPRADVIGFKDIVGTGRITKPIRLLLDEKTYHVNHVHAPKYEFVFKDARSKIVGISYRKIGKQLFDTMKVNNEYELLGCIYAGTRNYKYTTQSTSKYDLRLGPLTITEVKGRSINTSPGSYSPQTIDRLKGIKKIKVMLSDPTMSKNLRKKGLLESLKEVTVVGGNLELGHGCPKRFSMKAGGFICQNSNCPYADKPFRAPRKSYMKISGLQLKDKFGRVLGGVVAFNRDCEVLIQKNVEDFFCQAEAADVMTKAFGTKINCRIRIEKVNTNRKNFGPQRFVATNVEIVPVPQVEAIPQIKEEFRIETPEILKPKIELPVKIKQEFSIDNGSYIEKLPKIKQEFKTETKWTLMPVKIKEEPETEQELITQLCPRIKNEIKPKLQCYTDALLKIKEEPQMEAEQASQVSPNIKIEFKSKPKRYTNLPVNIKEEPQAKLNQKLK